MNSRCMKQQGYELQSSKDAENASPPDKIVVGLHFVLTLVIAGLSFLLILLSGFYLDDKRGLLSPGFLFAELLCGGVCLVFGWSVLL